MVCVYAVLCPRVLHYTLEIFNAGLAVLNTCPGDAVIAINGKTVDGLTPITLPNLPTGRHHLQVKKEGYQDFSRNFHIRKGEATALEHLLLIPESPPIPYPGEHVYEKLIPIEDTPFFIVLPPSGDAGARVVHTKDKAVYPLFPDEISENPLTIERIFSIPGSAVVVVKIRQRNEDIFLRITVESDPCSVQTITPLVANDTRELLWSADSPVWIFAIRGDTVERINLREESKMENFAEGWVGLGLGDGKVYGVDEDGRFFVKEVSGKMLDAESTEFNFQKSFFGSSKFVRIWPLSADSVLLHEHGGGLLQSELPNVLTDQHIFGLRVSPHTGDVLLWTDKALGIRQAADTEKKSGIFTEGLKIQWLLEEDSTLFSPTFVLKGSHILFARNGKILLYALNDPSAVSREVVDVRPGTAFHYVEEEGGIHALDPDDGRLVFFKLVSDRIGKSQPHPFPTPLKEAL